MSTWGKGYFNAQRNSNVNTVRADNYIYLQKATKAFCQCFESKLQKVKAFQLNPKSKKLHVAV